MGNCCAETTGYFFVTMLNFIIFEKKFFGLKKFALEGRIQIYQTLLRIHCTKNLFSSNFYNNKKLYGPNGSVPVHKG